MLQIEEVSSWTDERFAAALPTLITHARQLVDEHPQEMTLVFLFNELVAGRMHLWVVFDPETPAVPVLSVYVTLCFFEATGFRYCEVFGAAGADIRTALPLLGEIEAWARAQNVDGMRLFGRKGWGPLLAGQGYKDKAVVLTKFFERST